MRLINEVQSISMQLHIALPLCICHLCLLGNLFSLGLVYTTKAISGKTFLSHFSSIFFLHFPQLLSRCNQKRHRLVSANKLNAAKAREDAQKYSKTC